MRSDCAERAAAHFCIRPPVPRAIRNAAIVGTKHVVAMTHRTNRAGLQHAAHHSPAIQKPQLVIDQCKHAGSLRLLNHFGGLSGVKRHRLFAQHCFSLIECGESDLHVSGGRCDDAYEIDVVVSYQFLPIIGDVFNSKLFCDCFGAFSIAARNRNNLRSHAIAKARDLRRAGKPRPDDSDSDR